MKRKIGISLIVLSLIVVLIPQVAAPVDEWVTRTLDEDLFFATYLFDGVDMVYLQGAEMQIRSWFWFEGPVVQWGRHIKEAYLSVRVATVGGTDPDATMTIYGKPSGKGGNPSYYDDTSAINGPYTTNYVNVNLSSFVAVGGWYNITVTKILREINQGYYHYDGHDVAFVTLSSDDHPEERVVFSEESGNAAILYIHYGIPDRPPGVPDDAEYVEDYRNYTIWEVDHIDENRTGEGADVNWNLLNVTGLSEIDSGTDLTKQNATWITVSNYQDQAWGCIYNDTGSASIESFFLRFKIDVTNVNNVGAGNAPIPGVGGLSTSTPVGGGGLASGANGEWVGIITWCKPDDQSWRFAMQERKQGVGSALSGYSQWFDEGSGDMLYVEFRVNVSGATNWMSYDIYDDPEFTNSIYFGFMELTKATGPFRYAQIVPSLSTGTGNSIWNQYYTFLEMPVPDNSTIYIIDENGTIVDIIEDFDGNVTADVEDYIDEEVIGYPDPEDPEPPGWEDSPITAHRFKLILFVIGMILFIGTPVWGFATRPDAAAWIAVMMSMLCGVALLWSLQLM